MKGPIESWRLFFPTAAALAVLGLGAWGAQIAGVPLGLLPQDHATFMLWGVMGAGVQGFLFTAYAKQNGAPLPSARLLVSTFVAQLLAAATLLLRPALPLPLVIAVVATPWVALLAWAVPVARASLRRKGDATTAAVPLTLAGGLVGVVLHVCDVPAPRGVEVGVHAFLVPLALAVLDRVLPFFSSNVTPGYDGGRSPWFLGPLLVASWVRVLAPGMASVATAALLLLLARQWWGWRPWPAARTPMIAVIHVGIAWLATGWVLELAGASRSAALHALLVGGMGSLLLGISMRVVRGHGRLPMRLGRAGGTLLALAQLAALTRVWAGLGATDPAVLVGSAGLLAGAFAVWLGRFGRVAVR